MHPFVALWLKIIGAVAAIALLVPVGFVAYAFLSADTFPPVIENYQPVTFAERTSTPFYYSIGDKLYYSDRIDPTANVLFSGKLSTVMPSPDGRHSLVVTDNSLWLVSANGTPAYQVTAVRPYSPQRKTIGEEFYRNDVFQWSADSSRFYLIKDRYYETRGAQLFSIHGELIEYDLASRQFRKVFSPYRAFRSFFAEEGVFFEAANDAGDVNLMVRMGNDSIPVDAVSRKDFRVGDKVIAFRQTPFYTFSIHEYSREIFRSMGLNVEVNREGQPPAVGHLVFKGKRLLSIRHGRGIKGPLNGYNSAHSAFLPGNRFFLLNLYTGSFSGQLLIDTDTGDYKTLPKDTRVYRNINTHNFDNWTITKRGVSVDLTLQERQAQVYW